MELRSAHGRAGRGLAGAILMAATVALLFAWLPPSHGHAAPAAIDALAFCAQAPAEARAGPAERADVSFATLVPRETPADGAMAATSAKVPKGDIVRVTVTSPRDGGIAVHGLMDVHPISAGQRVSVEFRAIYPGRFPLHFHGADGSHFEIAAIEVLPQALAAAK
jgi:hypothetical protein